MIRKILSNNHLTFAVSLVFLSGGIFTSISLKDFSWLVRTGSLVTLIGILQIARPNITGKEVYPTIMTDAGMKTDSREYFLSKGEAVPDWACEKARSRFATGVLGPLTTLVGTVLSGFADLINKSFGC